MSDVQEDEEDVFQEEADALSFALLESDIGDRLHICRGMPFCDGSLGAGRTVDGELTYGCHWCHCHRKRGDETIQELMVGASKVIVH